MQFTGMPVKESPFLAGQSKAIKKDGTIHVSPAMMKLMRCADQDELQRLLESIKVIDFDKHGMDILPIYPSSTSD